MSEKETRPRKIRRRRSTGRVSGTTQSGFASRSMSDVLEQQSQKTQKPQKSNEDARGKKKPAERDVDDAGDSQRDSPP